MSSLLPTQTQAEAKPSFTPASSGLLQRKCACGGSAGLDDECEACRNKRLQRRSANGAEPVSVPPIVHEALCSPGQPLDATTRAFMEPRFGHDFSEVRVHTDAKAVESAQTVNAVAYTVGKDIVFDESKYEPRSREGSRLLAHELTHVIQQNAAAPVDSLKASSPDTSAELEAEKISNDVMSATANVKPSIRETTPSIQLQGESKEKSGTWWQKIKQFVGAEPADEEKLLSDLNTGLKRSQKLCEMGSIFESNPEAATRLKQAGEKFGSIASILGKGLSIRSAARDIVHFIDAIETLEGLDIQKDPEKAAMAFGKLFASAGRLGKRLPNGPWSGYFEWLANSENFFTNMRRKINPEERWKRQFEEIEK